MASENGTAEQNQPRQEEEPLLGRPGDATQHDHAIQYNFFIGTAILAQAGIWILAALVWSSVFMADDGVTFFSYHPVSSTIAPQSEKQGGHPLRILPGVLIALHEHGIV